MAQTPNAKPEVVTAEPEILTPITPSVLATSDGQIEQDVLYDPARTAQILGVSRRTLERWRAEESGPRITRLFVSGPPKYRGLHILEFIDAAAGGS
ncbi:hypothetical protein [Ruegeria sp. Alg231-54]|uniref:hypothetical protein n=1 Tax=Ruegeria sp. Alg231-54 TaxID=1922221 RepID=UPI000D55CA16|nr:hypothetical protein [Ruegeria sp. Alg231-54]